MSKRTFSDRFRTIFALSFFAAALIVVLFALTSRLERLLTSYTERQTEKQTVVFSLLMGEKLNTEIENLSYIASKLEGSLDDLDDIMPRIYSDSGVKQGVLSLDGEALYGEALDAWVYKGIQSSFRGNKAITFVEGEGLLFSCPVFHGPNIRYVLYRLCPASALEEYFAEGIYDNLGKVCVTTRDGYIVIPFYDSTDEDISWYQSEDIKSKFASMHMKMEVSVAAASTFSTDRGDMLLFEAEIPGTDFLVSGFVPKSVASEGFGNVRRLIMWVFSLLMLLVLVGAFYLTRVAMKAKESDELRKAKAVAEEASRAKGDFLANMSHEIRTPINAVLGMNEMILRESSEKNVLEYAQNVQTAGNTLLGIVNDILDFSKIEAGKIEIIPVEYDLSSVINDLVNMIQTRVDAKGLTLKLEISSEIPKRLYGDEVRIKQVITNILTNAVKYTETGSVTFCVDYVLAEENSDQILLYVAVKDTGIGIKEEDMGKLFSKFDRIEEKRNRNVEGTGLGMSITKRLLEMMGTKLEVESVYGEGSSFSFWLRQRAMGWEPLGDYEQAYRASVSQRKKYKEKFTAPEAQVLVVDDTVMNLTVFKSLLKKTQIQIDTAERGDEAITLAAEKKYDLIFLDHMMPGKDGIETLHEIRENTDGPNAKTPYVCLTANAISGAREKYLAEGFNDYLTKPIDSEKLEEMLIKYLPGDKVHSGEDGEDDGEKEAAEPKSPLPEWLSHCDGLDVKAGEKNCGGAEEFITVLTSFYLGIREKADEIEDFCKTGDIENYTIRVHALKSSARIIGANELSEKARLLEEAGKENNQEYIRASNDELLELYRSYQGILSPLSEVDENLPEIPADILADAYDGMSDFVAVQDYELVHMVLDSVKDYRLPPGDKERFDRIKERLYQMDWDGISAVLRDIQATGPSG